MNPFSSDEIILLCKSDGLLSHQQIKKKLKNRNIGTIKSFFNARFPGKQDCAFNGMPYHLVSKYDPSCPYLFTQAKDGTRICLWIDLAERIEKFPESVRESIAVMADFQIWLHQANPNTIRKKICKMIAESLS